MGQHPRGPRQGATRAPPSPLNPEFAELFGLNEAEKARVETELAAVSAEQSELDFRAAREIPITEADGFLASLHRPSRSEPRTGGREA